MKTLLKIARLRPGDLLFSEPKKKPWWRRVAIEMPQGGERYGHSAIYAGKKNVIEASLGSGVSKIPLKDWKEKNNYKVYRVKGVDKKSVNQAIDIARGLVGKGFSVPMALKSYVLPRAEAKKEAIVDELKHLNGMFCSTVLGGAYPGVQFDKHKHNLDLLPVDIKNSKLVKRVWW